MGPMHSVNGCVVWCSGSMVERWCGGGSGVA